MPMLAKGFLLFVCTLTLVMCSTRVSLTKRKLFSLEERVKLIITNYFNTCDIIFSEDTVKPAESSSSLHLFPNYSIRYSLCISSFISDSLGPIFPVRKYSQCLLVLTVLNEGTSYLPKFEEMLIQGFGALTQVDEDYYIFVSNEKQIELILNSFTLNLIKYKLVISAVSENYSSGFSLCFYCPIEQGHYSQVVTIDLINSTLLQEIFPDFTLNGHKYAMRTSSPTKYKFTTEIQEIDGKWELIRGISKAIMDGVLPHYNFTYVVFSSPNGDTGAPDKNGTWNGCIGQLLSGEAELSLTTSANHARFLVIGFSTAAFYAWVSFTVGLPEITYSWKAIFWPFKMELWLAVIASLLAVILVFKMFEKFDTDNNGSQGRPSLYKHLITEIAFTLIGESVREPEAIYSRILLCSWILSAFVFNSFYNSKIVGLLAQPVYESPPRTFEDLADSKFSVGMDFSGGSLYAYFQTSTSPIFQKIFAKFEKPKETVSCFEATSNSKFACITWGGVADYIGWRNFTVVDGQSPFLRATDITYFVPCGLAMPRNAVFKPNFDKTLSMIYDTGHGNRWIMDDLEELQRNFLRWQREELNRTVVRYGDNGLVILKLSNILGVFYIFVVGHTVATLGFFFENVLLTQCAKKFIPLVNQTPFKNKD